VRWESTYDPLPSQRRFHAAPALEKLFLAGVGTGKTMCGVHESAYLASDNADADGAIVSPTYPMLRDVILPLWEEWIPPQLYTLHKSSWFITWHPTGRRIFLRSADRPGRLAGLNLGWAWLDEASTLQKNAVWRMLQGRIRSARAARRCLFATTTPLGFNWLVREFRRPGNKFVVRARTAENTHLPPDFEPGLRAAYGDELAAQYLDAVILELAGLAWPILPTIHFLDLEEMKRRTVRTFGGVDWGHTNPAALIVGGVDNDGRWMLLEEWYQRGKDRSEIADQARALNAKWNVTAWWADVDPEGVKHLKRQKDGVPGCTVRITEKSGTSIEASVQNVRSLLAVRHDRMPRLFVHPLLKNWFREADAYQFPEDAEIPVGGQGDHLMDATRYMIWGHSTTYAALDYSSARDRIKTSRWGDERRLE
jgi:phage terminase large subunit-like protein